jgi:signal transduction histidine kinase
MVRTRRSFRFSSRFYLTTILVLLFVLDGLSLWLTARLDYSRTLEYAEIILQRTAISLEERVKRTIDATEAILYSRVIRFQENGIEDPVSSKDEWERVRRAAETLPDSGSLWLLDEKADLLMDSTQYPSQRMNYSEREYFVPHKDKGVEFYIGPVVKGKVTKKFSFTISHRISGKDGRFRGILLAAIDVVDFTNFLNILSVGKGSSLAVFRTDGTLIFAQPMQEEYLGRSFKNLRLFNRSFDVAPSGIYETDKWMDSVKRLVAYRTMQDKQLIVVASVPTESVLEEWRTRFKLYASIAIIIAFALTGLSWFVHRTASKEERERSREIDRINQSLMAEIAERKRVEEELQEAHEELESRVQQRTHELYAASEQLRMLSARLESVREEERTRIAREIHDELGQALTGLKMDLSWLVTKPPEDQQSLIDKVTPILELLDSTVRTVRRISTELRPGVLDDLGLVAAIEWLVEDFRNRSRIECRFMSGLKDAALDPELSTALFRILQEALTNVIRHADASHVTINIEEDEGMILLEIEDNGKGIVESDISDPGSLGILGIRERVLLLGGHVYFSGSEGRGTVVAVRVPLKRER